MYDPLQECRVIVTIEAPGEPAKIRLWRGGSARAIHKAAKKAYPGATLGFGHAFWVTL